MLLPGNTTDECSAGASGSDTAPVPFLTLLDLPTKTRYDGRANGGRDTRPGAIAGPPTTHAFAFGTMPHGPTQRRAKGQVMRGISAGARVWVKNADTVQFGVVQTTTPSAGYFAIEGSLVIVLDGGRGVVATTITSRGTIWDVVSCDGGREPS